MQLEKEWKKYPVIHLDLSLAKGQETPEDLRYRLCLMLESYKKCSGLTSTKFSQLSIFSTINNLLNVTMEPKFAAICGITEEELTTVMAKGQL